MRKPSKIPFFTQALTRQPIVPADPARPRGSSRVHCRLNRAKSEKCSGVYWLAYCRKAARSSACNQWRPRGRQQPGLFEHVFDLLLAGPRAPPWADDRPDPADPSATSPHFTGMGFASTKLICMSGRYCAAVRARRRNRSDWRGAPVRVIAPGIWFEATEMTPRPPSAITGTSWRRRRTAR